MCTHYVAVVILCYFLSGQGYWKNSGAEISVEVMLLFKKLRLIIMMWILIVLVGGLNMILTLQLCKI